jgi:hypothetical protein
MLHGFPLTLLLRSSALLRKLALSLSYQSPKGLRGTDMESKQWYLEWMQGGHTSPVLISPD